MPTQTTALAAVHRDCPLCNAPLDATDPENCPQCDWTLGYRRRQSTPLGTQRDTAAMMLSVIPGLGHIYKGYTVLGVLLVLGAVLAVCAAGIAATATMGLGLILMPLYWIAVMLQVYWLTDRRLPAQ